jgi:hypothetical protein
MGDVYRCRDLETEGAAALKVIRKVDDHSRFRREATILAALSHAAIVRYLAHGSTERGTPYLAMEWLEGEDLAKVLTGSALPIADCIELTRRVCGGLALAHHHGFVHRDIKPSNLFLCGGRVEELKLLDFGVAHRGFATQTSTRVGTMLGTVGYMSPEQAWGVPFPDPRDDLFSLGCVLFECLTGQPAFSGVNAVAVLESVLQVEPPDVRSVRPDVPAELAELVQQLLRKERKYRPPDSDSVVRALDAIGGSHPANKDKGLSISRADSPKFAARILARGPNLEFPSAAEVAHLDDVAHRFGAMTVSTRAGAQVFVVATSSELTLVDVAEQAVNCAVALHELRADLTLYVACPTENVAGIAVDELANRAHAALPSDSPGTLFFDPVTAALIRSRYDSAQRALPNVIAIDDTGEPRPIRFVGRDAELSVLEAVLEECKSDEVARTLLATAPVGFGKSRLLEEFLSRVRADEALRVVTVRSQHNEKDLALSLLHAILGTRAAERVAADAAHCRRAFTELIEQACASSALVVCIDDAQWADLASMRILEASLAAFSERPLLILGMARTSIPKDVRAVWQATGAHELTLRPLSDRIAERFVNVAAFDPQDSKQSIQRAGGNPRLLHALVLASSPPANPQFETAAGLFAEQLTQLPVNERNVLSAASIFADRVWPSAVGSLFDGNPSVQHELDALCERTLLVQVPASGSPSEREYSFSHPIVRETAYRCLRQSDRDSLRQRAERWCAQRRLDVSVLRPED